jgi:3alpha(or 20beta)-hydroxysteroid dehydrogenase
MGRLTGKIAIITGAARGMGAAEARLFVDEGARVLMCDVLDTEGSSLADELGEAAKYQHLDVTEEAQWNAALDVATNEFGTPDVLVNNAGVLQFAPIVAMSKSDFDRVLAINLVGPFLGMKTVGASMMEARSGSIVNISSTGGLVGMSMIGAYTASKWGLRGLTKSAAIEFGHQGVRVNSVHPGGVDTPMANPGGGDVDPAQYAGQPIQRIGRPEEVAQLALFLASDESSYSTGSEFVVDGGQTAGIDLSSMLAGGGS